MDRKVRAVQYGCGRMGRVCMKFALDHGVEIAGAYDLNPELIGVDIGDITEREKLGVKVSDAALFAEEVEGLKPDIVIVTTLSLLKDVYDVLMVCAEKGINAITTCEEAIYPWNSSPELTERLDEAAKKTGATVTGAGAQDLQWCSTVNNLAAGVNRITRIEGTQQNNIDDYGIAFAESFGAGMDTEEFEAKFGEQNRLSCEDIEKSIKRGEFIPSFMWNSNTWLAKKLGLTVKSQTQKLVPEIAEEDIESSTLGRTIKKGQLKGATSLVETVTEEGVVIKGGVKAIVYGPDDYEHNNWAIYDGETVFRTNQPEPPTVELTCATMVNRIPDVLNAPSGYVTTDNMPECRYLAGPMEFYVKD
ncbi:MAG TPA: dihydrodipicolinate reductase [Candidatus Copromorpha excrementigallinarum]|uniref:Dihydrodipicolinate reductase n=1 Tax=Candidatus Allocopromorpha excrementigallinarum TaxID=2840742 RepID=A0A9D1I128_9FIRM|nr:dihydrodipicolinate reductase [Candidatus Copromorpha excrementigallinarum]